MAIIDIKPGNIPKINAMLRKLFLALNFSLLMTYATDKVNVVEIKNEMTETKSVFMNQRGNKVLLNKLIKL